MISIALGIIPILVLESIWWTTLLVAGKDSKYEIETRGAALRENPEILRLEAIQRWDGILPRFLGDEGGLQFLMPINND